MLLTKFVCSEADFERDPMKLEGAYEWSEDDFGVVKLILGILMV